ncbi:Putative aldehyde dehydrogenase DhaS (fragment) [Cupriavidus necator]|uniref:Putative aldehyde dehydrogenase DhaS n=1 Tax=Cupriavidus necator TaxID=106590 RepID=A0A1K0IHI5_CUPNE
MTDTPSTTRPAFLSNPDKLHFIDGKWQPSVTGGSIQTFNPATGKVLATLARGAQEDINVAVAAARRAFEGPWSRFTPHDRYALMLRVCAVIERHFDELAVLDTLDMGAPLRVPRQ